MEADFNFYTTKNFIEQVILNHDRIKLICETIKMPLDPQYHGFVIGLCDHITRFQNELLQVMGPAYAHHLNKNQPKIRSRRKNKPKPSTHHMINTAENNMVVPPKGYYIIKYVPALSELPPNENYEQQNDEIVSKQEVPEVPEVTDVTDVAEVTDVTDVAEVADVTDVAPVAEIAHVHNVADVVNVTEVPNVHDVADVTEIATVHNVTDVADVLNEVYLAYLTDVADVADTTEIGTVADVVKVTDVVKEEIISQDSINKNNILNTINGKRNNKSKRRNRSAKKKKKQTESVTIQPIAIEKEIKVESLLVKEIKVETMDKPPSGTESQPIESVEKDLGVGTIDEPVEKDLEVKTIDEPVEKELEIQPVRPIIVPQKNQGTTMGYYQGSTWIDVGVLWIDQPITPEKTIIEMVDQNQPCIEKFKTEETENIANNQNFDTRLTKIYPPENEQDFDADITEIHSLQNNPHLISSNRRSNSSTNRSNTRNNSDSGDWSSPKNNPESSNNWFNTQQKPKSLSNRYEPNKPKPPNGWVDLNNKPRSQYNKTDPKSSYSSSKNRLDVPSSYKPKYNTSNKSNYGPLMYHPTEENKQAKINDSSKPKKTAREQLLDLESWL